MAMDKELQRILGLSGSGIKRRGRKTRMTKLRAKHLPNSIPDDLGSAMEDPHMFTDARFVPRNEVVLGVYSAEDWAVTDASRRRFLSGENTIQFDVTWLVPSSFKLNEWVLSLQSGHIGKEAPAFIFFAANRCIINEARGLIKATSGRGKLECEFMGHPEWALEWIKDLDSEYKRAESMIEWVYSQRGDEISVPLNYRPAIKAAYPWLEKPIEEYIDDYLDSEASVIVLIGPPGTGKTTFIKNLIHRSGGNAKVAYDEKVMMDDSLFANFIDDESRFLIMEDADAFLQSRSDGNTMMHKFLNVSDGLISAADKKLVFSTNLPNIADIDEALMRPGRCFDILEFRSLTEKEAQAVIDETGKGKLNGKDRMTLAEIFSQQPSEGTRKKRKIGF